LSSCLSSSLLPYTTLFRSPERVPSGGAEERTNGDPRGYGSTAPGIEVPGLRSQKPHHRRTGHRARWPIHDGGQGFVPTGGRYPLDRKSTRLNSSHVSISYA